MRLQFAFLSILCFGIRLFAADCDLQLIASLSFNDRLGNASNNILLCNKNDCRGAVSKDKSWYNSANCIAIANTNKN